MFLLNIMLERFNKKRIGELYETISRLREDALLNSREHMQGMEGVSEEARLSLTNLLHYLALRRRDLRTVQDQLCRVGLSSLGRLEAHVDATLCAVLSALARLGGISLPPTDSYSGEEAFDQGEQLLEQHTAELLGEVQTSRRTRIIITMPSEATDDPGLIQRLVEEGMDVARINCAHDGPDAWRAMVTHIKAAETSIGRRCRIAFDLAGPKLRTGPVAPKSSVIRWKPKRDERGRVIELARVIFVPSGVFPASRDVEVIPVDDDGFRKLCVGQRLETQDTRDQLRILQVIEVSEDRAVATCDHTGYVAPGTTFFIDEEDDMKLVVTSFPGAPGFLELQAGDLLELMRGVETGQPADRDEQGKVICPARISCDFDPLFSDCREGEPILFDDGLIAGTIVRIEKDRLEVRIEHTAKVPAKLKSEKGINLPETDLNVPALTKKDLRDLAVAVELADMISLSFVRQSSDVEALVEELERLEARDIGVVLKIENRSAFENLAPILLTAIRRPPVGVMIARGDLGVELGFQRMAEVQEEILWLCEAAHVPVIWATQVLESLAKSGHATRAEVTDAAMSSRAECVMLNKGPHIIEAVKTLDDILRRMEGHQSKKSSRMRILSVAAWKVLSN